MLSLCPRCQRANPAGSAYCWFDGGSLLSAQNGVQTLAKDFIFPSGRRCQTLEDFAQTCQDEWPAARELLSKDAFRQYFIAMGRHDLVRLAQEVMQEPNPDVGLSRFVDGLPVARTKAAKLDLQPRRFTLGRLPAGDKREIDLVLANIGTGTLQGTVTITDGADWLKLPDSPGTNQAPVQTANDQHIRLSIDASKLKSAQHYIGQLMVVTSGGVAEVPVRFELIARPFAKAPFQGVRTPRELAEKMRSHPKQAGPMLEGGDVERWFAANNWDYPVQGPVAKGMAGVQQFFEAMGLSRPPQLQISQKEIRLNASYPDTARAQVAIQTASRKWVYGTITSTQPWLKVLTPKVIGPQTATILLEADPTLVTSFPPDFARIQIVGNGGQKLEANVVFDVADIPRPNPPGRWRPVLVAALAFLLLRLALIPIVDLHARSAALNQAAQSLELTPDPSLTTLGGCLELPWVRLLTGIDRPMPSDLFAIASGQFADMPSDRASDFRHFFIGSLIRLIVVWTWWLGPVAMIVFFLRRGDFRIRDLLPAVVAGSVAGVLLAATLACAFLAIEIVPHALWSVTIGGAGPLPMWLIVAALCWTAIGAFVGFLIVIILKPE